MAKRYNDGMYAGMESRRKQEMEDAGMIREDHSCIANLPQGVMYKDWPKAQFGVDAMLDDTIRGVDRQMGELDGGKARKGMMPKKV